MIVVIGAIANLLGWDIRGWFKAVWDTITSITAARAGRRDRAEDAADDPDRVRLVRDPALRVSGPGAVDRDPRRYAASVALNGDPAGEPRHAVMLLMFTTIIAGATFAGILGGYAVQKIFFT